MPSAGTWATHNRCHCLSAFLLLPPFSLPSCLPSLSCAIPHSGMCHAGLMACFGDLMQPGDEGWGSMAAAC